MRVISTVHKAGWDVYGDKFLAGLDNWPEGTEFIVYTEGFTIDHPKVTCRRVEDLERAEAFKAKYKHYRPVLWQWDILKWCNKVFAAFDALYEYEGLAVWLDADCHTYKPLPKGYVERMLPEGHYLAMFKRIGWQTETGFWVMDCSHKEHKRFMYSWLQWLESGSFKTLSQWCDASTLDATVRVFEKRGAIRTVSLSGQYEKDMHPMAMVDLARYIDHMKGARKETGSPENTFKEAA